MKADAGLSPTELEGFRVSRRWNVFAMRVILTAGVLSTLVIFLHGKDLLDAMKRTGMVLWVGTVVFAVVGHTILAAKWRMLLQAAGMRVGMVPTLRSHGAGLFSNIWLPSLVGGDVVRAGMIAQETKNLPASITGVAADRITDLASLLVLAVIGIVLLPGSYARSMVGGLAIGAVTLTAVVSALIIGIKVVNPGRLPSRLAHMLNGLKCALDAMLHQKGAATVAVLASTLIQAFFIFQNAMIAHALGIHVPMAVWFMAFPAAKLVAFLPVSLGGLGLREGVVAVMLLPFSVPATLAVAQSLVWQTVTFATALVGGVAALWMGALPWRQKKVKRI